MLAQQTVFILVVALAAALCNGFHTQFRLTLQERRLSLRSGPRSAAAAPHSDNDWPGCYQKGQNKHANTGFPRRQELTSAGKTTSKAPFASLAESDSPDDLGHQSDKFRSGFVSILGNPNVGKSTLMNRLLGESLCIVSPKPQTTRHRILGILTVDAKNRTPGTEVQKNTRVAESKVSLHALWLYMDCHLHIMISPCRLRQCSVLVAEHRKPHAFSPVHESTSCTLL
jgi:hypothetical protein